MKTKTLKIFGKTLAVYGKRKRYVENRYAVTKGVTFNGLHLGKTSHYLSLPVLAKRKFGGQADITFT